MKHCPPPEAIAAAMTDPDSAAAEILEHIAGCTRCRSLLDSADPPVNWRLLSDPEADQPDEPKTWFLDRLKTAVRYTMTAPEPESGPSVPGYDIETEIARGGMGVVYRARDKSLDRFVAIKLLRSDLLANPTQLARFVGEAKALASLQHPNVVQLFQVGEADGRPFLVMEYVAGGTLRHAMRTGPWEATTAAQLVRTLADGVAAAHRLGIIHRDLKPGNVLLARAGGEGGGASTDSPPTPQSLATSSFPLSPLPKIADFGLARFLEANERPTQTGEVFGTPEFMAPEQVRGDQHGIGPETDVWALGVILYELLTGRVPFVGTSSINTMELVKSASAVSPELVRPGVPPELVAICLKCLEKLPYRRYHTAAALRDDLDSYLAGRPVSALPRSSIARLAVNIRRRPWVAVRWSGVIVLIAVLLGIIVWQRSKTHIVATSNTSELARMREQHQTTLRELYAARITLADDAVDEDRLLDAEKWLTLCRPTGDDPDARGWEWNYLSNRLRGPAKIDLRLADTERHGFDDVNLTPNAETTSPDHRRRVVIGPKGRLGVYDREGRLLMEMPTVPGRVVGVRFSRDGRWLAVRTEDDSVIAFDGAAP